MVRTRISSLILVVAAACAHLGAGATELVYTPVNPTFGGNPNNAAGLLNNANAQNDYKAPVKPASTAKTPLQQFSDRLQSAILSRLSQTAVNDLFDADGRVLANRTVTAGNFIVSITTDAQGNLVMTTEDKTVPGSATQVVIGNVQSN